MPNAAARKARSLAALSATQQVPITELLAHVSGELRKLCVAAFKVEAAIEPMVADRSETGLMELQGLQELDRIIQYIDGLADYLAALSQASTELGSVDPSDARRLIKVARLAEGLAGRCVTQQDMSGDVEML